MRSARTHTHTHTHTHKHTHTHTLTHSCSLHTHQRTNIHMRTCSHTHTSSHRDTLDERLIKTEKNAHPSVIASLLRECECISFTTSFILGDVTEFPPQISPCPPPTPTPVKSDLSRGWFWHVTIVSLPTQPKQLHPHSCLDHQGLSYVGEDGGTQGLASRC